MFVSVLNMHKKSLKKKSLILIHISHYFLAPFKRSRFIASTKFQQMLIGKLTL